MPRTIATIMPEDARRLFMHAQGLLDDPARRADRGSLHRLIERLGFVQLDSINVVERAHHLTLHSRLDGYQPKLLTTLLDRDRRLFEHWTHDASAIPTAWYCHWFPRFAQERERILKNKWWRKRVGSDVDGVIDYVRRRIEREGPLQSRDFEDESGKAGAWWGWKPQKAVLEYLWRSGELAIVKRINFQKVYDLSERVFPEHHHGPPPDKQEHIDWACTSAMERLVLATAGEIAAYWRAISVSDAHQWCKHAMQNNEIVLVKVETMNGMKPRRMFALPDWEARLNRLPEPPQRIRLLSPFDPVLRDRHRAERLFGFHYRFEAFVPLVKRKHGYYVLPILEGDQLIGRLDPKFHRDRGELVVQNLVWEPGMRMTKARRAMLNDALDRLVQLIGADRWSIQRRRDSP